MRTPCRLLLLASLSIVLVACAEGGAPAGASASASAAGQAPAKSTASATAAAAASAAPPPSASAPPRSDCPKDSAGPGTFNQPCAGKGAARMMEAKWTGKTDDEKGPYFAVINKSPRPILYGRIAVYFYDKDGKQLEVKDAASSAAKPQPYLVCAGANLFGGVMKVNEKATLTFSCVKKSHVPEGTTAIEGELVMVGFADAGETGIDYYWSNKDLAPDARPKGGVK
jgi:hypothetical protein